MLAHPIVSPAGAEDWSGSCPMWLGSGEEQEADSARIIAKTAVKQGVYVKLIEFEGMPHTFFWAFPNSPQSEKCMMQFGEAIIAFAEGGTKVGRRRFLLGLGA